MPFDASDEGTLLVEIAHPNDPFGPRPQIRAVKTLLDLPSTYVPEAEVFNYLAVDGCQQLAILTTQEREALCGVLLTALWRSKYHRSRFLKCVDAAHSRFEHYAGRLCADTIAQAILFETQAFFAATHAIVEGIAYVGGRRAGDTPASAEERIRMIKTDNTQEAVALHGHIDWYGVLTDYRNALFHRGVPERFGYVPPYEPQVADVTFDVMLVPDRASVVRPNRPDSWTFNEGKRLEVLVRDLLDELLAFVRDVGTCWGFAKPAANKPPPMAQYGSTIIVLPHGAIAERK